MCKLEERACWPVQVCQGLTFINAFNKGTRDSLTTSDNLMKQAAILQLRKRSCEDSQVGLPVARVGQVSSEASDTTRPRKLLRARTTYFSSTSRASTRSVARAQLPLSLA